MMTLDHRLAQEIVTRTMKIIPFNVNVMDAHGTIIGSGEYARIGEQHAGAQLAIAQGRTVEVDSESVRYLVGARPGVNLLLTVRGQICGVVGLTGEVRGTGADDGRNDLGAGPTQPRFAA